MQNMESIITTIFSTLGVYLLAGMLFSIIFLWKGIEKVDAGVKGSGIFFKLLIFPAMTVFWIVFLRKWIKSKQE